MQPVGLANIRISTVYVQKSPRSLIRSYAMLELINDNVKFYQSQTSLAYYILLKCHSHY